MRFPQLDIGRRCSDTNPTCKNTFLRRVTKVSSVSIIKCYLKNQTMIFEYSKPFWLRHSSKHSIELTVLKPAQAFE